MIEILVMFSEYLESDQLNKSSIAVVLVGESSRHELVVVDSGGHHIRNKLP